MARTIIPAIMSGGSGTRLWPLSTDQRPKQFHALGSERTMIQETAVRLSGEAGGVRFAPPIVIGNASQADLIVSQLEEVGVTPSMVILEPVGRNTAATAALAAIAAMEVDPSALVLLVPADHVIADEAAFHDAIARAAAVGDERIVTFGIVPTRPEIGYGYIESGDALVDGVNAIKSFKEKPHVDLAQQYLDAGTYYWNAGIFLFGPETMLREFDRSGAIRDGSRAAFEAARRDGVKVALPQSFADVPSQPVDIAVMETTKLGAVAPCDIGWADVGSWFELWRLEAAGDDAANVEKGRTVALDCKGSLLHADGVVVAAAGIEDLIVVATKDAVLIVPKSRAQDVKKLWEAARKLK